jgi:membrane protein DedA with SNARE-associated domain
MSNFHFEWRGFVAAILAFGLSTTVIILSTGTIPHINTDEGAVLSTVLGATVGALASYLGGKRYNDGPNGNNGNNGS